MDIELNGKVLNVITGLDMDTCVHAHTHTHILYSKHIPPPPFVVFPGPSSENEWPQIRPSRGPAQPAPGLPTHPQHPLLPPGGAGGGGGSRVRENPTKWRRPLEPRRDRALSRAPAHARASARCLPPLPLAGAGRPILWPHTTVRPPPPVRGRGHVVTALRSEGQPAPSPG